MNPEAIGAALERTRAAGRELRRRPARETLDALARVLDAWSDAASPWRRELEARLPGAAGFSPACVREGLRLALEGWDGEELHALVADELGGVERLDGDPAQGAAPWIGGFESCATLLAGALPMPNLLSLLAPLVLRTPLLARPGRHDPVTPELIARSIAEADAGLGACLELVSFPSDDQACLDALLRADCVVATGSDESVAAVAARVTPPRRFVGSGHRLSVAALGETCLAGARLDEVTRALALDVALWDQLGCLSPLAVYVASPDAAAVDRVAEALAGALDEAERCWPRGRIDVAAAARFARERDEARLRAAAGRRVAVHEAADGRGCVVREDSCVPRPAPLHRFVRVHPAGDTDGVLAALQPVAAHLAAVALAGFDTRTQRFGRALAGLGASRLCAPGRLQAPPLGWRREGRGVLLPLARFTSVDGF